MRILILADMSAAHTFKWTDALAKQGYTIGIFDFFIRDISEYLENRNITFFCPKLPKIFNKDGSIIKIVYIFTLPYLFFVIIKFKPDILHAHYISSYGVLGALSGFKPFFVSVWGSDIYEFPSRSVFHKFLIKFSLKKSTKIFSTSKIMVNQIKKYTSKSITVIPFGINLNKFKAKPVSSDKKIYIGTVKKLEKKYGIEYLLRAFKIVLESNLNVELELRIIGTGSELPYLNKLAADLQINSYVNFIGDVKFMDLPMHHQSLSISVFPSIYESESFGVAVLEACACEKPVIVSNIGGLPEIVIDGYSGLIVEPENEHDLAKKITLLITDPNMRQYLGKNGRQLVKDRYDFQQNLNTMIQNYISFAKS